MSRGKIEFWFDFSSAYAHFAALEIEAVAARHGRDVLWRPFMLGAAFRITGARGLSQTPMKRDYARLDHARIARRLGRRFALPPHHPSIALPAVRAFYHVERTRPDAAAAFVHAMFEGYFERGIDTSDPFQVGEAAAAAGLPADEVAAANGDPELKAIARERSDEAISRGIFGSPWIVADGEPFWGWDRLPMLESWLEEGGW